MMKVRDLITKLLDMPINADVQLHLDEEFCDFKVVHATADHEPSDRHLVAIEPEGE